MNWNSRIRTAFPAVVDEDVIEELAQHVAAIYAAARAEGCDAREAERRADDQIHAWTANPELLRRRPKRAPAVEPPAARGSRFATVLQDARYAARLLGRQPAYAAVLILTMALGISATAVLGSVTYGVLLKPLPWADAPRLMRLYETRQGSTRRMQPVITNVSYVEWSRSMTTLDGIGGWTTAHMTVTGERAERMRVGQITPDLLPLLNATPHAGRPFAPGDDDPARPPVLLISYGLWQQRFGGRPDAIGATLRLNATTYTIIGVMPASFAFPDRETRAWTTLAVPPVVTPGQQGFYVTMFQAVGRLRPGATPAQAAAEGTARARNAPPHGPVAMAVFGSTGPAEVSVIPMLDAITSEVKPAILILLAAVVLLLATATANAAGLQLARATARRRELAFRAALGASRGRIVRQTLVENLLIGLLGGVAGLLLAMVMHRALPSILPADFPRLDDLAFDWRIQAFAVAVSIVAGLGCGVLPAWHVARADVVPALVEDSLAPVGGGLRSRTARARAVIMAGQVAIASILLVGSVLLGRSFLGLLHADVGFDRSHLLTATIILPDGEFTPQRRQQTMDELAARLRALPGVTHAGYTTSTPFSGGVSLASFPFKKRDGTTETIQSGTRQVSAGYFAALGQRVLEGREFTDADGTGDVPAVIVNREFSRRYVEGRALGWTLPGSSGRSAPGAPAADRPIVGVVEDTARQSVTDTPEPEMYFLSRRQPLRYEDMSFVVRATGDPRSLIPSVRAIAQSVAPGAPLEEMMTMEDKAAATLSRPRLYAVLLITFAVFALAIAGVGLFGVLSYTVAQRSREIGVRTALGAQVRDIVGLVVRQSMAIAGAGAALGLLSALWLTRALRTYLYGVTPHDALSFAAVAVVLLAVAAVASVVPARRAARVDPIGALRR